MGPRALIAVGAAVVAFFVWRKVAGASEGKAGFGAPGFVAAANAAQQATVTGCSFARAGGILVDANTGKEISEAEAQRRAKAEGCTVPPPSFWAGASKS